MQEDQKDTANERKFRGEMMLESCKVAIDL
jgi:hypothetical protein